MFMRINNRITLASNFFVLIKKNGQGRTILLKKSYHPHPHPIYVSIYQSIYSSIYLSIHLYIYLSIYLSIYIYI